MNCASDNVQKDISALERELGSVSHLKSRKTYVAYIKLEIVTENLFLHDAKFKTAA